jgi:hypothetical protein
LAIRGARISLPLIVLGLSHGRKKDDVRAVQGFARAAYDHPTASPVDADAAPVPVDAF